MPATLTLPTTRAAIAPRAARSTGAVSVRAAQSLTGKVVSTKAQSTIVVEVDRFPPHPLYSKRIR
jgi:hypothetical protein